MLKNYLWNQFGARFQFIKSQNGEPLNWLFLPGGPGLGSESLYQLTQSLNLPGTLWHLDLPGDGSNITANNTESFQNWAKALIEAIQTLDHVILVGHSTGGMYALSLPSLEKKLRGLVLMNSAPNASWQINFQKVMNASPIPQLEALAKIHEQNPSQSTLKELTVASAPYLFTKKGLKEGIALLQSLPYNYETVSWSEKFFDSYYQAQWIPTIPTLIFAGSDDCLTPLTLFKNLKEFHRENIMMKEINHAGHFPWIENPTEIIAIFNEFAKFV